MCSSVGCSKLSRYMILVSFFHTLPNKHTHLKTQTQLTAVQSWTWLLACNRSCSVSPIITTHVIPCSCCVSGRKMSRTAATALQSVPLWRENLTLTQPPHNTIVTFLAWDDFLGISLWPQHCDRLRQHHNRTERHSGLPLWFFSRTKNTHWVLLRVYSKVMLEI